MLLYVQNRGRDVVSTNYWQTPLAAAGKLVVTVNAGALRLLLPKRQEGILAEISTAQYAIVSVGPWPEEGLARAVELLFEDGTDAPFAVHLSPEAFDRFPGEPPKGELVLSVWVEGARASDVAVTSPPIRCVELPARWRRSAFLPDRSPWEEIPNDAA